MLSFDHIRNTLNTIQEDVLTLYLKVDNSYQPNQAERAAWRIHIENALSDIRANHLDERGEPYKKIEKQINDFLQGYQPSSKSLVMFVSENTFHTHELPISLDNTYSFGAPMLVPLLWAIDEFERYLVILVDQEQARFMSAYLGSSTTVKDEMKIDFDEYDFGKKNYINRKSGAANGQAIAQGSKKDQFDDIHDAHLERFYIDIAESIRDTLKDIASERVVLGGNSKSANAVYEKLHQTIQEKVIGIINLPINANEQDVAKAILDPALKFERANEMKLVESVVGLAKSGGRGALGEDAVRKAFQMQQVETLIVPFPIDEDNHDLIWELSTLALENGAQIEVVYGAPAAKLQHEGAIAARLYYAINEPQS